MTDEELQAGLDQIAAAEAALKANDAERVATQRALVTNHKARELMLADLKPIVEVVEAERASRTAAAKEAARLAAEEEAARKAAERIAEEARQAEEARDPARIRQKLQDEKAYFEAELARVTEALRG